MTQQATVLSMLKKARGRGITPFDGYQEGIHRLAARVLELREQGHEIQTILEPHSNGKHARYVLLKTKRNPAQAA